MTLQLIEGQDLADHYALLHRVSHFDGMEGWLALDKQLNERVFLKIFTTPLTPADRATMAAAINATRGLVHPNIARIYGLSDHDNLTLLSSQYVRSARPLGPLPHRAREQWGAISQLFDALAFAHSLSLSHGHLHPDNLLVDDKGQLHITDFGLPSRWQENADFNAWLSPQVRRGERHDPSDDIFSLGQLLHTALTGKEWHDDDQDLATSPIPSDLRQLLRSMLRGTAYDRPRDLRAIKEQFAAHIEGTESDFIAATSDFSRAGAGSKPSEDDARPQVSHRSQRTIPASWAYAALLVLLAVTGAIFFVLPEVTPSATAPTPVTAAPVPVGSPETARETPSEPTPLERARQKQFDEQSQRLANELLRHQIELEDAGVHVWAPAPFQSAVNLGIDADNAYRLRDFEQSLQLYNASIEALKEIKSSMPTILADNRMTGDAALDAGDVMAAIRAFTIVLAIDASDPHASISLARALNLDQLNALLSGAEFLEDEGKLIEAREKLLAARKLDGSWPPATRAMNRLSGKIARQDFNAAMSKGMAALNGNNFDVARNAFLQAAKILPESTAPTDGMQQIEIAIRGQAINAHREAALALEGKEAWQDATVEYEATLAMDPSLVFASEGIARARQRVELDQRLTRFLTEPTLMRSDDELGAAKKTLADASRIKVQGTRLTRQLEDLAIHISLARVPVDVAIRSDNQTDVTIYKVGNLGKFDNTRVSLMPGAYKVVGTRRGYRDVGFDLTLIGGRPVPEISISCTEKI